MTTPTFTDYANYETWNVAFWVLTDEFLLNTAKACVEFCAEGDTPWEKFIRCMMDGQIGRHLGATPDGVSWNNETIDARQMERLMTNLRSGY